MRRLIVATLVVALAWAGFWVFASTMLERAIGNFLADPHSGVRVEAGDVSVAGFPNRLDTTFTDISVTLPGTGTTWSGPFLQLFALVYRPNEVIAAFPPGHRIETAFQSIDVSHDRGRASAALHASDDLALDRATLVIENGHASSSLGWAGGARELRLSIAEMGEATYRLGSEGLDLTFAPLPAGLPQALTRLHIDATATFDRVWNRFSMNAPRLPQPTHIEVAGITVDWGQVSVFADGAVMVDDLGIPDGHLDLQITGWREALEALIEVGLVSPDAAPTLRFAMTALADGDRLNVPLRFRGGLTTLGPLPIGPAPRLWNR